MRCICRLGPRYLKPRGHIDAVSENIVAFDKHIAQVDPDPEQHSPVRRHTVVAFGHHRLNGERAFDRINNRVNSISTPSPVVLTTRPPCFATSASKTTRCSRSTWAVPTSS